MEGAYLVVQLKICLEVCLFVIFIVSEVGVMFQYSILEKM